MAGRRTGHPRALLALALLLLVLGACLAASGPSFAVSVTRLSDRSRKLDLLADLTYRPSLFFFGGSRSLRLPPAYAASYAGVRAFNFAFQEATTEDYWAITHHIAKRYPGKPLYVLWGLQPNIFADRQMDAGLVRDERLNRYFPLALLVTMAGGAPHYWNNRRFASDGHVVYDSYNRMEADGRTLDMALDEYIRQALRKRATTGLVPEHWTRAKQYFSDGLAYMNQLGCAPLVMIMPVHPRVIAAVKDERWVRRRANFMSYLVSLQATYRFTILDFTYISRFGGDPDLFYDGVHMRAENSRRLLKAAIGKAPWAFGLAPAPWDLLHTNGPDEPGATPMPSPSGEAGPLLIDQRFSARDDRRWPTLILPER